MLTAEQREAIQKFEPTGFFTVEVESFPLATNPNDKNFQYMGIYDSTASTSHEGLKKEYPNRIVPTYDNWDKTIKMECLNTGVEVSIDTKMNIALFMAEVYSVWREMYA